MGSLYSLSAVYMNHRHTARKPACQQIHEALSMAEGSGYDPCVCACVCMLIYVRVCVCSWACLSSCVGVRVSVMMQSARLLVLCACLCICVYENLFVCGGIFIIVSLMFFRKLYGNQVC